MKKQKAKMILDGDIEFVSLVYRGANMTPFKVLKGGDVMPKRVVRVLIPKGMDEETAAAILDQYRTDEEVKHENYTAYVQVDDSAIKADTVELARGEKGETYVVASLKEEPDEVDEKEDKQPVEPDTSLKEVSEYTLFEELDALWSIVSGAMRQSSASTEERKATIRTAVSNFVSTVDMVLQEMKMEDIDESKIPARKSDDEANSSSLSIEDVEGIVDEKAASLIEKATETLKADITSAYEKEVNELRDELKAAMEDVSALKDEVTILKKQPATKSGTSDNEETGSGPDTSSVVSDSFFDNIR